MHPTLRQAGSVLVLVLSRGLVINASSDGTGHLARAQTLKLTSGR